MEMAKNQANPDSEIAKFVRAARGALKLTQTEFADKFNCTKGNVSAWEQGRHEPAFAVLNTMASVSGVELPSAQEVPEEDEEPIRPGALLRPSTSADDFAPKGFSIDSESLVGNSVITVVSEFK